MLYQNISSAEEPSQHIFFVISTDLVYSLLIPVAGKTIGFGIPLGY